MCDCYEGFGAHALYGFINFSELSDHEFDAVVRDVVGVDEEGLFRWHDDGMFSMECCAESVYKCRPRDLCWGVYACVDDTSGQIAVSQAEREFVDCTSQRVYERLVGHAKRTPVCKMRLVTKQVLPNQMETTPMDSWTPGRE